MMNDYENESVEIQIGSICKCCIIFIATLVLLTCLFMLFMPLRWNYECLGVIEKYEEGKFVFRHDDDQTVDAYTYKVWYVTPSGEHKIAYYDNKQSCWRDHNYEYIEKNEWSYVYKYRWWTSSALYFFTGMILLAIGINVDFDEIWTLKIPRKKIKLKNNTNNNDKIW